MYRTAFAPHASAFFTERRGGPPPYGGGNLALHVGDDPASVAVNRAEIARELGDLVWMDQVHGVAVAVTDTAGEVGKADAVISVNPAVSPAVLVADCAPVLLANASGTVTAAVHVGRRGLVDGVIPRTLETLRTVTDEALHAVLGPHICGGCYEVGAELAEEAEATGAAARTTWGTPSLDLAAGIRLQLRGIPLRELGICTRETPSLYSYRRDGTTGRFAGIVRSDTPWSMAENSTHLE